MSKKNKNYSSPENNKEGCLCKNGKYSKRCCKGKLLNQGIGKLTEQSDSVLNSNPNIRVINKERG